MFKGPGEQDVDLTEWASFHPAQVILNDPQTSLWFKSYRAAAVGGWEEVSF